MNLKIQIRRNRSMQLSFKCAEDQKRFIEMMAAERPQFPPLPPEIQAKIDEANRRRIEVEGEVWKQIAEGKIKDLSGNIITPETHEICYDMEPKEINGQHFMVSTQMYIQPKKSELLNGDAAEPPRLQDMEPKEIDGQHFMVPTQMYIQPKKSELLNGDAAEPPRLQEL